MNDNTKIELANEIMIAMVGKVCRTNVSKNSKIYKNLLKEQQEMRKFNFEVIDRIISVYGPMVKEGKI